MRTDHRQLLRDALQAEYVNRYAAPLERVMQDQREALLKMLMAFRTYGETNQQLDEKGIQFVNELNSHISSNQHRLTNTSIK